ncbi:MAG TPA: NINE protein, partial [Bacteroidia bacterium]|nr:NINE protein [Bacteroidia bacterium]
LMAILTGFASFQKAKANSIPLPDSECRIVTDIRSDIDTFVLNAVIENTPPSDSLKQNRKKKIVCALFALPFPCGFVGAHRVMLGTNPWIPVIYVATFGGCFGLLPLIDFCFITFSKDITPFENNPHVFMWVK